MPIIRIYQNIGFCIAPILGVFWFRTNKKIYFIRAPWNHPLFSERYGYVNIKFNLYGWRFITKEHIYESK